MSYSLLSQRTYCKRKACDEEYSWTKKLHIKLIFFGSDFAHDHLRCERLLGLRWRGTGKWPQLRVPWRQGDISLCLMSSTFIHEGAKKWSLTNEECYIPKASSFIYTSQAKVMRTTAKPKENWKNILECILETCWKVQGLLKSFIHSDLLFN